MEDMLNARIILLLIMHIAVLACGIWDVVAVARGHYDDAISPIILDWSQKFPILPFMIGVIIGHLLWPQFNILPPPENRPTNP